MASEYQRKQPRKRTKMVKIITPKIRRKIDHKPEGGLGEIPPTGGQYEGKQRSADRHIAILHTESVSQ